MTHFKVHNMQLPDEFQMYEDAIEKHEADYESDEDDVERKRKGYEEELRVTIDFVTDSQANFDWLVANRMLTHQKKPEEKGAEKKADADAAALAGQTLNPDKGASVELAHAS